MSDLEELQRPLFGSSADTPDEWSDYDIPDPADEIQVLEMQDRLRQMESYAPSIVARARTMAAKVGAPLESVLQNPDAYEEQISADYGAQAATGFAGTPIGDLLARRPELLRPVVDELQRNDSFLGSIKIAFDSGKALNELSDYNDYTTSVLLGNRAPDLETDKKIAALHERVMAHKSDPLSANIFASAANQVWTAWEGAKGGATAVAIASPVLLLGPFGWASAGVVFAAGVGWTQYDVEYFDALMQYREMNMPPSVAVAGAKSYALGASALEALGTSLLLRGGALAGSALAKPLFDRAKGILAKRIARDIADGTFKRALRSAGKEYMIGVLAESTTEAAQQYTQAAIGNIGETFSGSTSRGYFGSLMRPVTTSEGLGEILGAGLEAFKASMVLGSFGGAIGVSHAGLQVAFVKHASSLTFRQQMARVKGTLTGSEVAKTSDPVALAEAIDAVTPEGQRVTVDPATLLPALHQDAVPVESIEKVSAAAGVTVEEFIAAADEGRFLELSLGQYIGGVLNTGLEATFDDHIKLRADGFTIAQVRAWGARYSQMIDDIEAQAPEAEEGAAAGAEAGSTEPTEAAGGQTPGLARTAPAELRAAYAAYLAQVTQMLLDAGVPRGHAETLALMEAAAAFNLAARAGVVDPADAVAPLAVRRGVVGAAALAQDSAVSTSKGSTGGTAEPSGASPAIASRVGEGAEPKSQSPSEASSAEEGSRQAAAEKSQTSTVVMPEDEVLGLTKAELVARISPDRIPVIGMGLPAEVTDKYPHLRWINRADPNSGWVMLQADGTTKQIALRAVRFKERIDAVLSGALEGVDAVFAQSRAKGYVQRTKDKVKGAHPSTGNDYYGSRIIVEDVDRVRAVLEALARVGYLMNIDEFLSKPRFTGMRALHVGVFLPEFGLTAEVQILVQESLDVIDEAHVQYNHTRGDFGPISAEEARDRALITEKIFHRAWLAHLKRVGREESPLSFKPRTKSQTTLFSLRAPTRKEIEKGVPLLPLGEVEEQFTNLLKFVRYHFNDLTSKRLSLIPGAPNRRPRKYTDPRVEPVDRFAGKPKPVRSDYKPGAYYDKIFKLDVKDYRYTKKLFREAHKRWERSSLTALREIENVGDSKFDVLDADVRVRSFRELRRMAQKAMDDYGGIAGIRTWYRSFGRNFQELVGSENVREASMIFGITSAQNEVNQNYAETLQVMRIARRVDPVENPEGFYEAVRTYRRKNGQRLSLSGSQIAAVIKVYQEGTYTGGLKVGTYSQLVHDQTFGAFNPFTVMDVHMARFFGFLFRDFVAYQKKGHPDSKKSRAELHAIDSPTVDTANFPGHREIRYAQYLTALLARVFKVSPHEMQAILWFWSKENLAPGAQKRSAEEVLKSGALRGSLESVVEYAADDIAEIKRDIADGAFDTGRAFNENLQSPRRTEFEHRTRIERYSTVEVFKALVERAKIVYPKALVSTNAGGRRGYGFGGSLSLEQLWEHRHRTLSKITDDNGRLRALTELGVQHFVDPVVGTYEGLEPSMRVVLPYTTVDVAFAIAQVLGDALLQDSVLAMKPSYTGDTHSISFSKPDGAPYTHDELVSLYLALNPAKNPDGLNFTANPDRTELMFLDPRSFDGTVTKYGLTEIREFARQLIDLTDDKHLLSFGRADTKYDDISERAGSSRQKFWSDRGFPGSSDVQRTLSDLLYRPAWEAYAETVALNGLNPNEHTGPLGQTLEGTKVGPNIPRYDVTLEQSALDSASWLRDAVDAMNASSTQKYEVMPAAGVKVFAALRIPGKTRAAAGKIVAVSDDVYQSHTALARREGYGVKEIGPILERGYIDRETGEWLSPRQASEKHIGFFDGQGDSTSFMIREKARGVSGLVSDFHQGGTSPRGGYTMTPSGEALIELGANRDRSTLIHEFGHRFLDGLRAVASRSPEIQDRLVVLSKWFSHNAGSLVDWVVKNRPPEEAQAIKEAGGVKYVRSLLRDYERFAPDPGNLAEMAVWRASHELWARGFERFTGEGKAPSRGLRLAFMQFSVWILGTYDTMAALDVTLTDEVREVMGSLLAAETEMREVETANGLGPNKVLPDVLSISGAEREHYSKLVDRARDSAREKFLGRPMRALARKIRAQRDKALGEHKDRAREDLSAKVEWRANEWLRFGRWHGPDDQKPAQRAKIAMSEFTVEQRRELPSGATGVWAANGKLTLSDAADLLGFEDGARVLEALLDLGKGTLNTAVAEQASKALIETYGPLEAEVIRAAEDEVLTDETAADMLAWELRKVRQEAAKGKGPSAASAKVIEGERELFRAMARSRVADMDSGTLTPGRWWAAEANMRRQTAQALAARDWQAAAVSLAKQLQLYYTAREVEVAQAKVRKMVQDLKKVSARKNMERLGKIEGGKFADVIQGLFDQVDLRTSVAQSSVEEGRGTLAFRSFTDFKTALDADGVETLALDDDVMAGQVESFKTMSYDKFSRFFDTVVSLDHLAKSEGKASAALKRVEFDDLLDQVEQSILDNAIPPGGPRVVPLDPNDRMHQLRETATGFDASMRKIESMVRMLDGGAIDGPVRAAIFTPMSKAQADEDRMLSGLTQRLSTLHTGLSAGMKKFIRAKHYIEIAGRKEEVSGEALLAIALNMGNEGNLRRLKMSSGRQMTDVDLAKVIDMLGDEAWDFVEETWRIVGSLWEELSELHRRTTGVKLQGVAARVFYTSTGRRIIGGYYPVVYDPTASVAELEQFNESKWSVRRQDFVRAAVQSSATKGRTKFNGPLLLSLDVVPNHIADIVHDISHREAIRDVNRVIADPRFRKAVAATFGTQYALEFRNWLEYIANGAGKSATHKAVLQLLRTFRQNVLYVGIGFRATTALIQPLGLSEAVAHVGGGWVASSVRRFATEPVKMWKQATEESSEMRLRFNNIDRDVREEYQRMVGKSGYLSKIKRASLYAIGFEDMLVSVPTYHAARDKALAEGHDLETAIEAGASAVRLSQGAGAPKDIVGMQRSEGMRFFTLFFTYLSSKYNLIGTAAHTVKMKGGLLKTDPIWLMSQLWFLLVVPAVVPALMFGDLPETEPDDSDAEKAYKWMKWGIALTAIHPLETVPGLNAAVNAASRGFGYQMSPLTRGVESFVNIYRDIERVLDDEDDVDPQMVLHHLTLGLGYATGLPTGQLDLTLQQLIDMQTGEIEPNFHDVLFRRRAEE